MSSSTLPTSRTTIDAFLATTLQKFYKGGKMQNAVFNANPFTAKMKSGKRVEYFDGGHAIDVNLMYGRNTTVGSYSRYDRYNISPQDGMTTVFYNWAQYVGTLAIDGFSEWANSGAGRLINLLDEKIEQLTMSFSEVLNDNFLDCHVTADSGATGPGNNGKNTLSLPALVNYTPASGSGKVIAGKDAYTDAYWRNVYKASSAGSFASLKKELSNVINTCARLAGGKRPTMLVSDQTTHELYEASMQEQVRYQSGDTATMGFPALNVKGIPYFYDFMVPDVAGAKNWDESPAKGTIYFLNENFLKCAIGKGRDMRPTKWKESDDQEARLMSYYLYIQLMCSNRAKQGVLGNIDWSIAS